LTVCIAGLFRWRYGENDYGRAALTISDRQITAGDIEYEPEAVKICFITPHTLILIAGDYPTHSEALHRTQTDLLGTRDHHPHTVAEIYASHMKTVKAERAAGLYLSPVFLTRESFLTNQHQFQTRFLDRLTNQLQDYQGPEAEAIVVGTQNLDSFIYLIDTQAIVQNYSDVGFAAIGIGAWHAKSQIMRVAFTNQCNFFRALPVLFAAKKAAEIAPGVGKETDAFLITRLGWERILPDAFAKVQELYADYETKRNALAADAINKFEEYFITKAIVEKDQKAEAQTDAKRQIAKDDAEPKPPSKLPPQPRWEEQERKSSS
jgi:hypothetical protein